MSMEAVIFWLIAAGWVGYAAGRWGMGASGRPATMPAGEKPAERAGGAARLYGLCAKANTEVAHPEEFLSDPHFVEITSIFSDLDYPLDKLLNFATGTHDLLACAACEALAMRSRGTTVLDYLLANVEIENNYRQFFFFRAIQTHAPESFPVAGRLLLSIARRHGSAWMNWNQAMAAMISGFIRNRCGQGEVPTFAGELEKVEPKDLTELRTLLERLKLSELAGLEKELRRHERTLVDVGFLETIGSILDEEPVPAKISHPSLEAAVTEAEESISSKPHRSVILVGEHGVGKTSAAQVLFRRLRAEGWVIFQAGAGDVLSGQAYLGQLEERLKLMVRNLDSARGVIWYVPDFHALATAGRHQYSATSALDYLLPHIERGSLVVVGEMSVSTYEKMIQKKQRLATIVRTIRLARTSAEQTLDLARRSVAGRGTVTLDDATLKEAFQLAQQFLGDVAEPGNLLRFIEQAGDRMTAGLEDSTGGKVPLTMDDLIVTLTGLTGLPSSILDDREALDPESLSRRFQDRVKGQPEASACLVERVAMLKAGVTDPTRPAGVFLFAGPTGTGKTEMAKTLASFLFGSPDRMIRLDMSEIQTEESLVRIVGSAGESGEMEDRSLVQEIRKQPFSVVLLDEFEKAHRNAWDLFLQVFDDGRLTDRNGNVANFSHSIIILTTNLGAAAPRSGLGFGEPGEAFNEKAVRRAIETAFRREFLNRIDRVVVFHPLSRETMREILNKELESVFERRGLRNRGWAVEWDEGAIEFLLAKGFTRDLGARPLKRAIEQHLLTPLAMTIVNHQHPEGDQFLFVRSDGDRLDVAFVDPDAAEEPAHVTVEGPEALPAGDGSELCRITAHASGNAKEVTVLGAHLSKLRELTSRESWSDRKQRAMERLSEPGFWKSPGRFSVLDSIEYIDRIESGLERTSSLYNRVRGAEGDSRERYPRSIIQRIAQSLYLLEVACSDVMEARPNEAFLLVEAGHGTETAGEPRVTFAREIGAMYRGWARRRGMQMEVLEEREDGISAYQICMAVSGFGAYSILRHETGLHIFEEPGGRGRRDLKRHQIRVQVAPRPVTPPTAGGGIRPEAALRRQAQETLRRVSSDQLAIVRRYRKDPSPLIRDTIRHRRTGRYGEVMEGDFDLVAGMEPAGGSETDSQAGSPAPAESID